MQLRIDALQIRQRHFLLQDHLIETDNEVCVKETAVEDTQAQASADELEVIQVLGVDTRCRVDLKSVVVMGGILEETVKGVKHFV